MTATRFLLMFPGRDGGWLRLAGGAVVERGRTLAYLDPPDEDDPERIVLVVRGVDVALHWIELPALAPAQALAAARLIAADMSAAPIDRLHVALGETDGRVRCMAVVDAELMRTWLAEAQALGFDPDHVVPEPLLLVPPAEGVRRWTLDGIDVLRGPTLGLSAEPEIAELTTEDGDVETIGPETVEAGLADALAAMPVDLRQGAFAKRRQWRVDWGVVRRVMTLLGAVLIVALLIQGVLIARYAVAANRAERELELIARGATARDATMADAPLPAQIVARLAALRGGGLGFGRTAALMFAAMRDTADVELSALDFDPNGLLRVTVMAANSAEIEALRARLAASGLVVETGPERAGGGRRIAEITVTPR